MNAHIITRALIIEDRRDLAIIDYALRALIAQRRYSGQSPGPALAGLAAACQQAMTPARQHDIPDPASLPPSQAVTTRELAAQLGCSIRTAQRTAHKLDGRKIGGRWHIDPIALEEHKKGMNL